MASLPAEDQVPTNFERAKSMLDELVPRVDRMIGGSADERVGSRCSELRRAYQGRLLDSAREPVDYSKPTAQVAYVYRTLPAHADWVFEALKTVPMTMQQLLSRGNLKVACIGGGPGSDVLGVVKYVENSAYPRTRLNFVVLDREAGWNTPRQALMNTFAGGRVRESYQHVDLVDAGKWTSSWTFSDADIFTFSFLLSEVWCYNASGAVTGFLTELINRAKSGALFVYVDNGGNEFTPIVEREIGSNRQLNLVGSQDNERMRMNYDERRDIVESEYCNRFKGERVKMGGNVSIRVWQKK
jgi:hypothetical protein